MALQTGTTLGPYEILGPLGAGGMGEVYKAADTRLNRVVAIKVLPSHFSENVEMKQRFDREAQTIARLNHPHICTLYDVGRERPQSGGAKSDAAASGWPSLAAVDFLVMEYLEGETLAARIERGALPFEEALKTAIAIADALDKAHAEGVIHRDLKPGNVMLTAGGAKLLDFGLAKVTLPSGSRAALASPPGVDTAPGMIMGTMQYMAPEQLEGQEADARTDIFAFGAVLHEMVTGKKAFSGRNQALLIAAIVSADPEALSKTQPAVPAALDYVAKRCLAKDPEQRFQTVWDLLGQLQWVAEGGSAIQRRAPVATVRRRRDRLARLALLIVAPLVGVLIVPAVWSQRATGVSEDTRFLISVPEMPVPEAIAISADGRSIAFSARQGAFTALFVRPIGSEVATRFAGTEGAERVFWSPDNRSIAFFAGGKLKKVDAAGGTPQNICETPDFLGGTWNAEGVIVFASSKGLHRVLAAGGEPVPIAIAGDARGGAPGQGAPQQPYFLPDGRHYLYLVRSAQAPGSTIYAGSLDSSDRTPLVTAQSNAVFAEPGYLLYHREGTLYAQPFNQANRTLTGEAIRIADRVPYSETGAGAFAASHTGVLVYRSSQQEPIAARSASPTGANATVPLLWLDRSGSKVQQAAAQARWAGVDLSPDGKRIAVHRHDAEGGDVWLFDTGNDTPSKLTFDATQDNSMPLWAPDGTRVAFGSRRNERWGLYVKLADNSRAEDLLIESELPKTPMSWSPDGQLLVYWSGDPKTAGDIWVLPLAGDKKAFPFAQTTADERHPQVSPDGKWIAYSSNESGRSEIYIRPFPAGPGKIQVSGNGGVFPRWRRDGKELYFMNLVSLGAMMAADIRVVGSSIQRDVPHILFQSAFLSGSHAGGQYHAYAVASTGQRFLVPQFESIAAGFGAGRGSGRGAAMAAVLPDVIADRHAAASPSSSSNAPMTVVINWTATLKK